MSWSSLLALGLFTLVAALTPGGATALATASGARFGLRRSLRLLGGMAIGMVALGAAAGLGLAGLLLAVPDVAIGLKTVGSLYLLWLSLRIARSGAPQADAAASAPFGFCAGTLLIWLNPKAWAMVLGAAAAFGEGAHSAEVLAGLLALFFGISAAASLTLWCVAGRMLARLLRTEGQWRAVNAALGLMLALSILPMWI